MEHYIPANLLVVFFWGLAVFFGMIGLGRLAAMWIGGKEAASAGWGLHAVWGIAVYLFLGGCLAVFHACTDLGISLLIGLGVAAMLWTTIRAGWPTRASLAAWPWPVWPAFALAALSYVASIGWQANVNICDDLGAYYGFCEKLLVTGTFDEPFSWRRLASLGGQTLLQCSTLANTSFCEAQIFEIGLCPLILIGLLIGFRGGALIRSRLGIFLVLVAVTTPILRFNTASHFTSVILFIGLFVTLDYLERARERRLQWLIAVGVVAAGLCTLRAQSVAVAGLTLAIYWAMWWLRDRPSFRRVLVDGLWCCGALLLALVPWCYMSYRSNESPLFPLFAGGNNFAFNPLSIDGTAYQKMKYVVEMIVLTWLAPLFACLLVLPSWKKGMAVWAVAIAAVVTSIMLAYGTGLAPDDRTIPRYVQPLLFVGAFCALAEGALIPRLRGAVWVLLAVSLFSNLSRRHIDFDARYQAIALIGRNFLLNQPDVLYQKYGKLEENRMTNQPKLIADCRRAQLLIPEGKRVLLVVDYPFLFDHLRNDLWNADFPHATSPRPGLPFHRPPEETKRYLRQLGVEYIIYVDFDQERGVYDRVAWKKQATGDIELYRFQEPFYSDFFDVVDALAASETVLGKSGDLTVVQFKP